MIFPTITIEDVFTAEFVTAAFTLLALIIIDLVFGVALALKTHTFQWKLVADFYGTKVLPKLLGWMVVYLVVQFATILSQNQVIETLRPLLDLGFYALLVASLLGSVIDKGRKIATDEPAPTTPAKQG